MTILACTVIDVRWTSNAFFGNTSLWIRSRATIQVVVEADYEIQLLDITSEIREDKTDIIKLQKSFIAY